jgi:hypothetical protein
MDEIEISGGAESHAPWGAGLSGIVINDNIRFRWIRDARLKGIVVSVIGVIFPREVEILNIGQDHLGSAVGGVKGVGGASLVSGELDFEGGSKRRGEANERQNDHHEKSND